MTDIVDRIESLTRRPRVFVAGGAAKAGAGVVDDEIPLLTEVVEDEPLAVPPPLDERAARDELVRQLSAVIEARLVAELPALLASLSAHWAQDVEVAVGRLVNEALVSFAEKSEAPTNDGDGVEGSLGDSKDKLCGAHADPGARASP